MKNKEFYLDCDGIALHAKMDFPEVEKPVYPMVIVIHGLTGHMEERHIKGLAAALQSGRICHSTGGTVRPRKERRGL